MVGKQHSGLDELSRQVRHDLDCLATRSDTWVRPRTFSNEHVYDVVIVGGGQSGMGVAFGLQRERIPNLLILDENPEGKEGPWDTYARMVTLRTPKDLTSIDLGVPSLTFRSYWEAKYGQDAWPSLGKIPRPEWMAYLKWYRKTLDLPIRNEVKVQWIEPVAFGLFRLHVEGPKGPSRLLARKVVLATGIQGGGQWHTPAFISSCLPRERYAHTSESIDFESLQGKSIGILGAGASSFDNAFHALTSGVAQAHIFVRRESLPRVNPIRHMESSGMIARFAALPDADKYAIMSSFFRLNQPPTNDTFERAAACPGFELHLGAPWTRVSCAGDKTCVETPAGIFHFDFLIISTGLITDPALRPELRSVENDILRWRDRYQPPADIANPLLDAHPYLDPGFAFVSRTREGAAKMHGLFAFNYSALISFGLSASALSGLKYAIPKVVHGIADQLFLDDREAMLEDYYRYDEPEFIGQWPKASVPQ
jgi:FAD-dependent urate hydroxylase